MGIVDGVNRYHNPPLPLTNEFFENVIIFTFFALTMEYLGICDKK